MGNITLKPLLKETPEKKSDPGVIRLIQITKNDEDESPPLSVRDFLLEKAGEEGCNLYGIIDSARNDEVFRYLVTGNVQYKSLFEGTMDVKSYGVSGFLVECKTESQLFDWMTKEAWGDSCCIFLTSKASFEDLFKHFQKFNRVYLEDDDVVLFRYYDPRVLRVYLPTCNRGEVEMFFGNIQSFMAETENPEILTIFQKYLPDGSDNLSLSNYKILITK